MVVGCSNQTLARLLARAVLGLLMVVSLGNSTVGFAQGLFRPMQNIAPGRYLDVPRSLQQALREAEEAIAEERFSDAVLSLGELASGDYSDTSVEDLQGQDFFLRTNTAVPANRPLSNSFLKRVRFLLGSLPGEAIDTYELRYGPVARKNLTEAASSRDWQKTREVRRRFFHTTAGYEASFLLSQQAMLLGHPLEASLYLSDLINNQRAVSHLGDAVILMYAVACESSGQELKAGSLQARFEQGGIASNVGGEARTFASLEELKDWAKGIALAGKDAEGPSLPVGPDSVEAKKSYAFHGGDASRNASSGGQLPLSNERWRLDTTSSPLQERGLRQNVEELTTSGKLPPPCWIPLRVGNQLLMRTTERLVGVDHRTGKRLWTYPWQLGFDIFEEEPSPLNQMVGGRSRPPILTQRVWNDLPYGQISSDGKQVYLLDQLGQVESLAMNAMMNLRGVSRVKNQYNTLVALDLATEGTLRWRLGADGEKGNPLESAFFLGPPLPVGDRLYVMAEIAGDICVCCLDPRSGEQLWRQQLVTVESGSVQTDPIRRVAGAMPTYHEGVLICPTGAGVVVGIDLVDRTLRWGATVERNAEMYRSIAGSGRSLESAKLMQRWHNGIAIADEGNILVTPIESDRLYGLSLLTGEQLFQEKNRVQMMYLAGIRDGKFFLVGSHQIRAFDVDSGNLIWTTGRDLISVGQQISGLGVFGEYDYFVPTSTNEIIQVSLSDGTVRQRRETSYPLGNLIAADGQLISQGPTSLSVAFGESTLASQVERRLSEYPGDFDATVRKAEILIQQGELSAALEFLDKAREIQPDNDEVRMLSVSALLGRLRSENDPELAIVELLETLIDRPRQRVELLGLQVRSSIRNQRYLVAAELLIELSQLVASDSLIDASDLALEDDPTRQCSLDSWIAAKSAEISDGCSDSDLTRIDSMLRKRGEELETGSDYLLRATLMHFGQFDGVKGIRNELADRMLERDSAIELERLAWSGYLPGDAAIAGLSLPRLQILAKAYALGRMPKDEVRILQEIESRLEKDTGPDDFRWVDQTPDDIKERISEINAGLRETAWPEQVSLTWDARTTRIIRSLSQTQRFSELRRLAGEQIKGWKLYGEGSSPLSLMSPEGMRLRIAVDGDVSEAEKTAVVSGGTMVVVTRKDLIAVNLHALFSGIGDPVLWQRPITGDGGAPMSRRSSVTPFDDKVVRYAVDNSMTSAVIPEFALGPVLGDRVIVLQGGDLIALDLITADTLWRNAAAPVSGAVVSDGERLAVVSDATRTVAYFDPVDGRQLGTEDWEGGQIWSSLGSHVLSYRPSEVPDQFKVQLTNPFSGAVILEHEAMRANRARGDGATESSYGRVSDARYLSLLSNQGEGVVWDLVHGRQIFRQELDPIPSLAGLAVMSLGDRMIWLPRAKPKQPSVKDEVQIQTSDGRYHMSVNQIHAINLKDGDLLWERKLDSAWGCTITQPAATPLLFLARSPFASSAVNRTRRKSMDVMAINIRNGETAQLTEGREVLSGNNQLETKVIVQPNGQRLLVEVGVEHLLYQFGETEEGQSSDPNAVIPSVQKPDPGN